MYLKPQSYEVRFLRYGVIEIFFVILGHFLPFYPPNNPEFWKSWKILEKWKKQSEDVIILHTCTANHNQMYASWDKKCDRLNFLSFWAIFCPFTLLLITDKFKCSKKCEDLEELRSMTDVIVILHFGLFFRSFNPLTAWKIKIKNKKEKKPGDIINLLKCTKNHDHMLNCS